MKALMTNTGIPAPALTSTSRKIPRALAHQVELLITRLIKTPTNNNIPAIIMLITLIKAIITNVTPRFCQIVVDTEAPLKMDFVHTKFVHFAQPAKL